MTITVRDLIALLEQCDPDWRVETEGCDCLGWAAGVEKDVDAKTVLVTRGEQR
jgi:hypothetical protein